MKKIEDMTREEREECLSDMRTFIESAVESEQDEPKDFKKETELRINFVCTNIREMLGLSQGTT